ncbi:MAG: hypothetical protein FVQ79_09110 [Planctomycetes bacterium]|nr:hypothetical protein [Planctomycetota bacterium]
MVQYRVNLDIFAGPLDLLLYLVRKDEVDIYDIPILSITEQFVKHIEVIKMIDIELAGEFLVMAATLMEIKSAMLIPSVDPEDMEEGEEGDPRRELVRQLLEYKRFKDAANMLDESAEDRGKRFTRPDSVLVQLKEGQEPELDLDEVSVWTLLEAFDMMMEATGRLHSYDHISDDTSIDQYQIELLGRLQVEGPMAFADIFKGKTNLFQVIGLFLALLELMRSDLIWAEQHELLGTINVRANTEEPAEKAVGDAIYKIRQEEEASVTDDEIAADLAETVGDADAAVESEVEIMSEEGYEVEANEKSLTDLGVDMSDGTIKQEGRFSRTKEQEGGEGKFSIPIKEVPTGWDNKKAFREDHVLKDESGKG